MMLSVSLMTLKCSKSSKHRRKFKECGEADKFILHFTKYSVISSNIFIFEW